MFNLAQGFVVHDLTGIDEGFGATINDDREFTLKINVSVGNIRDVFFGLSALVSEPTFAYVDIPSHVDVHNRLNVNGVKKAWKDSFFRDHTGIRDLEAIFELNSDLFIHDGMIKFGFACKEEHDQVYVGKFKLFHVYTNSPVKYAKWLESHGYQNRNPLRTVWDNFTKEHPGECHSLTFGGEDTYGFAERLVKNGFFFKRTIEEE